jgi:ribonuclease HI
MAEWIDPGSATDDEMPETPWVVYCDGAWGALGARATAILISPSGIKLRYATRIQFNNDVDKCTNNIAEYEAILLGLCNLRAIGVQRCILHTDSIVVSGQIKKECIAREPTLEKYLGMVSRMDNYFKGFTIEYIERNKNFKAGELVKAAARNTPCPPMYFLKCLKMHQSKQSHQSPGSPTLLKEKIGELQQWLTFANIMSQIVKINKPECNNERKIIK